MFLNVQSSFRKCHAVYTAKACISEYTLLQIRRCHKSRTLKRRENGVGKKLIFVSMHV
uniref:Uncharacterized protein n=1 Tax=Anguilla anguilla TaxID=7936 RepID=A0A0E9S648_ANGAN